MPLFGTRDVDAERSELPVVTALASEGWESEDAEVLNLTYEFDDTRYQELLPPALHPTIPVYGAIMLRAHDTSPVGPFSMAELRVMGRAGVHQGGYVLGGFASTPEAVELLRDSLRLAGTAGRGPDRAQALRHARYRAQRRQGGAGRGDGALGADHVRRDRVPGELSPGTGRLRAPTGPS